MPLAQDRKKTFARLRERIFFGLSVRNEIGPPWKDFADRAYQRRDVADAVDDHLLVIEENDIAVLAHDLDDQEMGAQVAHFIAVFHFQTKDPLESGLGDRDNAPVLQMFAQEHTEGRSLKGRLAAGIGQVHERERGIGAEIESELSAASFGGRAHSDYQFVFVRLRDFINTSAADGVLQFLTEAGNGDSVKSHGYSPYIFYVIFLFFHCFHLINLVYTSFLTRESIML